MPKHALTLMAVHAHPDDEVTTTGGVLAQYSAQGIRTVVVTCTDGSQGDGPGGVKPGEPGHDLAEVAAIRRAELEVSCKILGVGDLELLGYRDSGMMGWSTNGRPGSFWTTPVDQAAARLAELMHRYRPEVVVTYDENGFYGHPDHIQTHRVTMAAVAAVAASQEPAKVYWTTVPRSLAEEFGAAMVELGADWDEPAESEPEMGLPDEEITTWVDTTAFAQQKHDALAAHASQPENQLFLNLGRERFVRFLGVETFLRVQDRTGAPVPEDDLFAGLR